ncbi:MAG: hypothetical protein ACHP7K_01435, partial [Actinomycetales bacterium]
MFPRGQGQNAADEDAQEPFVPRPRYSLHRSTKVLAGILLVAVGFFGGAAVNSAVGGGTGRTPRSQFQNAGLGGQTGSTQNGGSGTGT